MKAINLLLIIICIGFGNCKQPSFSTLYIKDVTIADTINLESEEKNARIHKIEIIFSGKINGNAKIYQKDNQDFVKTFEIKDGDVDFRIYGEWYSNNCHLEYIPNDNLTEGNLIIKYKFYSF